MTWIDPEKTFSKSPGEVVYEKLIQQIITGEIKAGERLPTGPLAKRMGYSRMPVREAVKRLAAEGIVIITPGSGARVISPTAREVRDVYTVRIMLERLGVTLAIQKSSPLLEAFLQENLEEQIQAAQKGDYLTYLQKDMKFHHLLAEWGGNAFLASSVKNALEASWVYRLLLEQGQRWNLLPSPEEDHQEILQAFRQQSEDVAVQLMEKHILRGLKDIGMS